MKDNYTQSEDESENSEMSEEEKLRELAGELASKARARVSDDLGTRSKWEDKQRIWAKMRDAGLPRKGKKDWQDNLHVPLADSQIDKLKPYYYQQTFNGQRISEFVAETSEMKQYSEANSAWFDHNMRQKSNFRKEIMHLMDCMCQNGMSVIKKGWDAKKKRLTFEQIDPIYIIVPASTTSLEEADRITHVIHISEEKYRRNPNFDHSEQTVKMLLSNDSYEDDSGVDDEKKSREGITNTSEKGMIVLWETWERKRGDDGSIKESWIVTTYCPSNPKTFVRMPFEPNQGHDEEHVFVDFPIEIKDKGYYAPRGLCQRLSPYEAYASKVWNQKSDYLSFINKPVFEQDQGGTLGNTANFTLRPGSIMKPGLKLADSKMLPPDIQQEMEFTKHTAEELIMSPNFGIEQGQKDNRTATEISYIGQVSSQGQDLRASVYRHSLSRLYRLSWKTLVMFGKNEAKEYYDASVKDFKQIDAEGIQDAFEIEPAGTPEMWNMQQKKERSFGRFNLLKGDPFIDQLELRRDLISAEDPRDVTRLVIDPNVKAADEAEEQGQEITVMLIGFDTPVKQDDDDIVHCQSILQWITQFVLRGQQIEPNILQLITGHYAKHVEALKAKKQPQEAAQAEQALQATLQEAGMYHEQSQQMAGGAGVGV